MSINFRKLQEDRFILTTDIAVEVNDEGPKYQIIHKIVTYSNKKMEPETHTYCFEGALDPTLFTIYRPLEEFVDSHGQKLKILANYQKEQILKNIFFV